MQGVNTYQQKRWRAIVLTILLMVSVGGVPRPVYAVAGCYTAAWGDALRAECVREIWQTVYDAIQGILVGQLKMFAVRLLNSSIESLVGGVNGSGLLYISDWQQYLFQAPAQENQLFVNDLLSQSTRGKCSSLNFQSASSGALGSNYFTYLCNAAQASVATGVPRVNIDEYSTNPTRSLAEGDWRVFNALFSNPANNPLGYSLIVQQAQQADLARRMAAAQTEGIANQGYNSVRVGGVVVTPGRTVGDLVQNVKTLANNVIIGANNPAELVTGIITSVANQAINQLLQKGFEKARTAIQRETGKLNQQLSKINNDLTKTLGPANQYLQTTNQVLGSANRIGANAYRAPGTPGPTTGCAGTASGYGGC